MLIVNHSNVIQSWDATPEIKELHRNAKTLVLGSFNPYNPNGNNTDFYYGRCSNYFWKIIAELEGKDEQYYFNSLEKKLETMNEYSFLDLIASIEITSEKEDEKHIHDFVANKIFSGYSDSKLFTSSTTFKKQKIFVQRNYNSQILELLRTGRIRKVIHTLGNNTISKKSITKPVEKQLGKNGFQGFWKEIKNSIETENLIPESFSPSAYAVKRLGSQNYSDLKSWIKIHLLTKHP